MARVLNRLGLAVREAWLRRSILQALAVSRYEVRSDTLRLMSRSCRLAITWRARNVHPWDRDLAPDRRAVKLVEQIFSDTQAALDGLFARLPEMDEIDFKVLEVDEGRSGVLMKGLVNRKEFHAWHPASIPMRLRLLGVTYNLVGSHLEPLDSSFLEAQPPAAEGRFWKSDEPHEGVRRTH